MNAQEATAKPSKSIGITIWRWLWFGGALLLYLALALAQLGLPGLHYDEAREAGLNALELLTGAPVTAFRAATLTVGNLDLPLMVQDYIGAPNVYLALPFLHTTGIGVPNLRALSVMIGLLTLLTLERTLSTWIIWQGRGVRTASATVSVPISVAGLLAVTLLAASPSFVFWSRQGIFVTNLTQPLTLLCVWLGLHWLFTGRTYALWLSAFAAGMALYAKLLAIWIIAPFCVLAGGWWLFARRSDTVIAPTLSAGSLIGAGVAIGIPLIPLLLFNLETGGTLSSVVSNLGESYYGVNNLALGRNSAIRWEQVIQTLRGDHLWYLGGIYANPLAPWAALLAVSIGVWLDPRRVLGPLLLVTLTIGFSLFTVSDLFVTHYALLQPYLVGLVALGVSAWLASPTTKPRIGQGLRWGGVGMVALWLLLDLSASTNYHRALQRTGGLADHSDATYHLAYHLRYSGAGAPIALDWGLDAPVRYLTEGAVRPIEIFGYDSPDAPDSSFPMRLAGFLTNPESVYLLRAPDQAVFAGRRELFIEMAVSQDLVPILTERFHQRDGTVLFEVWRVIPNPNAPSD